MSSKRGLEFLKTVAKYCSNDTQSFDSVTKIVSSFSIFFTYFRWLLKILTKIRRPYLFQYLKQFFVRIICEFVYIPSEKYPADLL